MRGVAGWVLFAVGVAGVGVARGDTLYLTGSASNSLIEVGAAKVLRIEGNKLVYSTGGNEGKRDLNTVGRIALDDDPVLTGAERALSEKRWNEATDGYVKTMRSPSRAWVREWSALRMVEAAAKAGRFDAAVDAYVELVRTHPDVAERNRPQLPASGKSTFLAEAEAVVKLAMGDTRLNDGQRTELAKFLFEIQKAKGDASGAAETAEKLLKDGGAAAASGAAAAVNKDIEQRRGVGEMKLAVAARAAEAKDWKKVIWTVEEDKSAFVDAKAQAEALYLVAQARRGMAKTPDEMKDAAIAYMKVVAAFKDTEGQPRVNDALAGAAEVLEKLGEAGAAMRLKGGQ